MKLIANCQLTGVYGTVTAGQMFDAPDAIAAELLRRGVAQAPSAVKRKS
jgi:hypothetical protein